VKFKEAKKLSISDSEEKYKDISEFRKFSEEEISKLEEPTPETISSIFKVGDVIFDSIAGEGFGASQPKEILEASFYIFIKPDVYLNLAAQAKKEKTIEFLEPQLRDGYAIGIPRLRLHKNHLKSPYNVLEIRQHEGRGRTKTFRKINGDIYMPVLVTFPRKKEVVMANKLTEEILENILNNTKWIPQEDSEFNKYYDPTPINIDIEKIYWQGKEIKKT
jgi:hypothetical protein